LSLLSAGCSASPDRRPSAGSGSSVGSSCSPRSRGMRRRSRRTVNDGNANHATGRWTLCSASIGSCAPYHSRACAPRMEWHLTRSRHGAAEKERLAQAC
jgi:hypothetical protein